MGRRRNLRNQGVKPRPKSKINHYEANVETLKPKIKERYESFLSDSGDKDTFTIQNVAEDNACFFRSISNGLFYNVQAPSDDSEDILYSIGIWKDDKDAQETYHNKNWGYCGSEQTELAKKIQHISRQWLVAHSNDMVKDIPIDYKVIDLIRDLHGIDIPDDDMAIAFYDECYRTFAGAPKKKIKLHHCKASRKANPDIEDAWEDINSSHQEEPLGYCAIMDDDDTDGTLTPQGHTRYNLKSNSRGTATINGTYTYEINKTEETNEPEETEEEIEEETEKETEEEIEEEMEEIGDIGDIYETEEEMEEETQEETEEEIEEEMEEIGDIDETEETNVPEVEEEFLPPLNDLDSDLSEDFGIGKPISKFHDLYRHRIRREFNTNKYWDRWGSGAEAYALSQYFGIPIIVYGAKRFNFTTGKIENGRLYNNEKPDKNVRFVPLQIWGKQYHGQAPPIELLYKKMKGNVEHYMILYRN